MPFYPVPLAMQTLVARSVVLMRALWQMTKRPPAEEEGPAVFVYCRLSNLCPRRETHRSR
jgi:hypothetical protein